MKTIKKRETSRDGELVRHAGEGLLLLFAWVVGWFMIIAIGTGIQAFASKKQRHSIQIIHENLRYYVPLEALRQADNAGFRLDCDTLRGDFFGAYRLERSAE